MHALSLQAMLGEPKVKLLTVSKGKKSIKTAGGMTIVPDVNLYDLDTANAAALVLIGGDTWLDNEQDDVLEVASKLLQENILVGAICGATLGLAEKGILDNRYHTSNASFFLTQMSQHYRGQDYYKDEIIYLYPLDKEIIDTFIYFEENFNNFYVEIIIEDTETGEEYSDFTDYIYMMPVRKGFHFGPIVK